MAATTEIQWTDATVNFWWGCTKVGPGCDHCYAEAFDKRVGGAHWGLNAPRRKIASAVALIHRLDNNYAEWAADAICAIGNAKAFGLPVPNIATTRRVFIQSMSDLFDLGIPPVWFGEAWGCIESCNRIDVQIVTKRVSAVAKRLAEIGCTKWPQHAGLIITVCNQEEADRDIPRLLALKAKFGIPWVGLSVEPMLGPIELHPTWLPCKFCRNRGYVLPTFAANHFVPCEECLKWARAGGLTILPWQQATPGARIDWVICGGESGGKARPMHPDWARDLRDQCAAAGVPFHFKQWGEWWPPSQAQAAEFRGTEHEDDRFVRLGKKAAGRLLDGIEHNGMPQAKQET